MAGIGEAASIIAVINLSAKVASLCFEYSHGVDGAKDDITSLHEELNNLQDILEQLKSFLSQPYGVKLASYPAIKRALTAIEEQLRELDKKLDIGKSRNPLKRYGIRALQWPLESKNVEKIVTRLEHHKSAITLALQVDQTLSLSALRRKIDLNKLPQAKGATYDSFADENEPRCHPDTRIDLLRKIDAWMEDPNGKCMFWLYGAAGTGKSTISRTVARSRAAKGVLSASFFFKRGQGDRGNASRFFSTIACNLAEKFPALLPYLAQALEDDSRIVEKGIDTQFKELILKPLSAVRSSLPASCRQAPIVIDALDECEEEPQRIRTILKLLSELKDVQGIVLRIFVTSRPDLPVRLGFKSLTSDVHDDVTLHDIPEHIVDHDLRAVLASELESVRKDCSIQPPWPTDNDLDALVQISRPLFIHAATVWRFLGDRRIGNPQKLLDRVLKSGDNQANSHLRSTYHPVLINLVSDCSDRAAVVKNFQLFVGTIITLLDPLSRLALARLTRTPISDLDGVLDYLHSVLDIPTDLRSPIQLFHLSFHDFLVDRKQCEAEFFVNEQAAHARIAASCIEIMSAGSSLRENICGLEYPGKPRNDVSTDTIHNCIPAELRYACRYWVEHLKRGEVKVEDNDSVHVFLKEHILHWLEVSGLLGTISEALHMARTLRSLLSDSHSQNCSTLLDDAERFVLANRAIIEVAPMQVYPMVIFAPRDSMLRRQFEHQVPSWLRIVPDLQLDWSAVRQTLEGHSSRVNAVAFSPDGTRIASGSGDRTVRVWDASTGALQQTLEGHSGWVSAVAFSPDGTRIETNLGSYNLHKTGLHLMQDEPSSPLGLCLNNEWLLQDGQKLLWLPSDMRPTCSAISEHSLCVGCSSGRVFYIGINYAVQM